MFRKHNRCQAFTLVEMMVVVALIAVLVGIVFKLMSAAGEKNKQSVTVTRLERLQNALSGYYAEYGSYPPVQQCYQYPGLDKYYDEEGDYSSLQTSDLTSESGRSKAANRAARSQSLAYEYPSLDSDGLNNYIDQAFKSQGARSAGIVFGGQNFYDDKYKNWLELQLFKFGLLSYLLPKASIASGSERTKEHPYLSLLRSSAWLGRAVTQSEQNMTDSDFKKDIITAQTVSEQRTVARWLPNFEKIINGGITQMGIDMHQKDTAFMCFTVHKSALNGAYYVLQWMSITDGWGNELYYYSAPPYQSYRVWSSGPDGKTFPPWIPLKDYTYKTEAAKWMDDDIVRSNR